AICGIIDVFLVGKPGESPLGDITDKWFENRTRDFAKLCGWNGPKGNADPTSSAIGYLERHFKIPYDQRGLGDAGSIVFDLNASNHHFKSLGHNPSLLGLFFSILDQFTKSSHFVSDGQLIELVDVGGDFQLHGHSTPGKLLCGFVNWFCHIMSDISGSSGSKSRGMGIPSPLWTWINDIIVIKAKLNIPVGQFDKDVCSIVQELYTEGFDFRFQTAQTIPVFINESLVRLIYCIRRLMKYYQETENGQRSFADAWKFCKPFKNPTIRRMLTVAHGTFCLIDAGDATIRGFITGGGSFNPVEFFLRLNIAGIGRFAFSLYGEAKDGITYYRAKQDALFAEREKAILVDYLEGLNELAVLYNDQELLHFTDMIKHSNQVQEAFKLSSELASLRKAEDPLMIKQDIDNYFLKK
ncbi:MAG: hypothetical protein MJZ16_10415, partial [Bacteroidales bacterium]|nr:hypothetical protein [Bacteroidales bacterium]